MATALSVTHAWAPPVVNSTSFQPVLSIAGYPENLAAGMTMVRHGRRKLVFGHTEERHIYGYIDVKYNEVYVSTVQCHYSAVDISNVTNLRHGHPIDRRWWRGIGGFCEFRNDLCSAPVIAALQAISCYIEPRHIDNLLYVLDIQPCYTGMYMKEIRLIFPYGP